MVVNALAPRTGLPFGTSPPGQCALRGIWGKVFSTSLKMSNIQQPFLFVHFFIRVLEPGSTVQLSAPSIGMGKQIMICYTIKLVTEEPKGRCPLCSKAEHISWECKEEEGDWARGREARRYGRLGGD